MLLVIICLFISVVLGAAIFVLGYYLGGFYWLDREKLSAFECGFDPKRRSRIPLSMQFFLLAVIFLVFDVEVVLLMQLPLLLSSSAAGGLLVPVVGFLLILMLGLYYEWYFGSLNWII